MKNESNTQLKRSLGLSTVMLSVIGMVIGSGVFFKPQAVYTITGGAPGDRASDLGVRRADHTVRRTNYRRACRIHSKDGRAGILGGKMFRTGTRLSAWMV